MVVPFVVSLADLMLAMAVIKSAAIVMSVFRSLSRFTQPPLFMWAESRGLPILLIALRAPGGNPCFVNRYLKATPCGRAGPVANAVLKSTWNRGSNSRLLRFTRATWIL